MFSSKRIKKKKIYISGFWFSVIIFPFISLFLKEGIGKNANNNKSFFTGKFYM